VSRAGIGRVGVGDTGESLNHVGGLRGRERAINHKILQYGGDSWVCVHGKQRPPRRRTPS